LPALIDALFPDGERELTELGGLAREVATTATDASELRDLMIETIIRPDVPEFIGEVRIMSLHKSKGLSSPVVFIAGCMQGVIPRLPRNAGRGAAALLCRHHPGEGGRQATRLYPSSWSQECRDFGCEERVR
jgi:hypothetical protein